jgi:hypothetical protein
MSSEVGIPVFPGRSGSYSKGCQRNFSFETGWCVLLFCPAPLSSGPMIRIVLVSENARMDLQNKLQEEKQRSETRQTRSSERLKPTQILHT